METTIQAIVAGVKRGMILQTLVAGRWINRQILFTRSDARHAALLVIHEPGRYTLAKNTIKIRKD